MSHEDQENCKVGEELVNSPDDDGFKKPLSKSKKKKKRKGLTATYKRSSSSNSKKSY